MRTSGESVDWTVSEKTDTRTTAAAIATPAGNQVIFSKRAPGRGTPARAARTGPKPGRPRLGRPTFGRANFMRRRAAWPLGGDAGDGSHPRGGLAAAR